MKNKQHDAITKRFLTNIEVAIDFLKSHLPEHIKSRCDFSTLRIEPTSFVEDDLRQHITDILYSLKIDGELGFIYCLVEAQSEPLKMMPLRMLRYLTSALKRYAENNRGKKLPVIVPLLLYTGKRTPYPFSLDLYNCFSDPKLARETLLNTKLIDVSIIPDEEIKTHGNAAFLEIVQKHIKDIDILNLAHDLAFLLNTYHLTRDLVKDMLNYTIESGESEHWDEFMHILTHEATGYKEVTMTIAEQLKQQGKQQGAHEQAVVIAQNMLSKGSDVNFIREVTGLSQEELSKLKKSH